VRSLLSSFSCVNYRAWRISINFIKQFGYAPAQHRTFGRERNGKTNRLFPDLQSRLNTTPYGVARRPLLATVRGDVALKGESRLFGFYAGVISDPIKSCVFFLR
jgi:hypothetical protein